MVSSRRPTQLKLGSLTVDPVIYSPLAGCSDYPFRKMCRQYSNALVYCEMVKMDPLLRHDANTYALLDYCEQMHPIGAQLVGSKAELAGQCAKVLEELGFDVIDFNCGCPVDKVTKDGSGSGMMRYPDKIGEIIANMVAAVKIPVTVKIRAGWDDNHINAEEITKVAEAAGAKMIAIHGRTRKQGYSGKANRDVIRDAKRAAKTIKVAGNGDIFDVDSALHMFDHTQCDAILISRGTMGQPWLARDILQALQHEEWDSLDAMETLLDHFDQISAYRNDRRAALDMRRVGPWYCKETHRISDLRSALSKVRCMNEAKDIVRSFIDAPSLRTTST